MDALPKSRSKLAKAPILETEKGNKMDDHLRAKLDLLNIHLTSWDAFSPVAHHLAF